MKFKTWLNTRTSVMSEEIEEIEYRDFEFEVYVTGYEDQPTLTIPGQGSIRLFLSGAFGKEIPEHFVVHMIKGDVKGAGTILYFAALMFALKFGVKNGYLAADSTLSPDAIRARQRMQQQYSDYLYILPHPYADSIKVHRNDGSNWRRMATPEEATMWRLKNTPPFEFNFHKK